MASKFRQVEASPPESLRGEMSADNTVPIRTVIHPSDQSSAELPSASVVICTLYRPEMLRRCLQSLSEMTILPNEILVVDNSGGDPEAQQLAGAFGARYVVERIAGLSRARNWGLAQSRCDVVAFLDDDCIPDPRWLENLLIPFSDQNVAAVTGEVLRFSTEELRFAENRSASEELRYVTRDTSRWFEIASFGGIGSGGNMAFRRATCQGVSLFDERLGRGAPFRIAEENCAFVSILAQGYSAVRIPDARVYHPEKERNSDQEAASIIAYWLFLFENFPQHRLDLVQFLFRRSFRRPLGWRLESPTGHGIVASDLSSKLRAAMSGLAIFFRARGARARGEEKLRTRGFVVTSPRPAHSNSAVAR